MHDALPPLREVIAKYDLNARKTLGQNFILDLNLTSKIARSAGDLSNVTVYEVGPGPGGLTRGIVMAGAKSVIVVEKDPRCLPALEDISAAYPDRLQIRNIDALSVDEKDILGGKPARVIANLPYNVGTALLIKWLTQDQWLPWYQSLTLMFQKEVAERIIAQPNTKAYGRLSVLSQWRADVKKLFDVPAQAFTPPPKVTSSIVHIIPKIPAQNIEVKILGDVTAAAFGQRRKMLRAALKSLTKNAEAWLQAANIDPKRRAESLSVEEFVHLAQIYEKFGGFR